MVKIQIVRPDGEVAIIDVGDGSVLTRGVMLNKLSDGFVEHYFDLAGYYDGYRKIAGLSSTASAKAH